MRRQAAIDQGIPEVPIHVVKGITFYEAKAMGMMSNLKKGNLSEYDESKHPRGEGGRWAAKPGAEVATKDAPYPVQPPAWAENPRSPETRKAMTD